MRPQSNVTYYFAEDDFTTDRLLHIVPSPPDFVAAAVDVI